MRFFPHIRHSIAVRVPIRCPVNFGIIIPTANIVLGVRQTRDTGFAAFVFYLAAANLGDDARVVFVERGKIAANIGKDIRIGFFCGVSFHERWKKLFIHPCAVSLRQFAAALGRGLATRFLIGQPEMARHDVAGEVVLLSAGKASVLRVERVEKFCGGAGLIIIIHEVDLVRAAVGRAMFPIEDDVVS